VGPTCKWIQRERGVAVQSDVRDPPAVNAARPARWSPQWAAQMASSGGLKYGKPTQVRFFYLFLSFSFLIFPYFKFQFEFKCCLKFMLK
jgi:hypothetical protein